MVRPEGECFQGVPYDDLPIEAVDWEHRADHLRDRTMRYGDGEVNLEPEWATEAALDPKRLVGPGSSKTSIEVIGFSPSAPAAVTGQSGRVLKVWLVPKGDLQSGEWWGASACVGNGRNQREYWEGV
jgi:hypothetical protein